MKKIFTLMVVSLLATSLFAADHRPVIRLNNNKNYKVVIDGRSYFGDDINIRPEFFNRGHHTVRVYEMRRGFFGRTERLVDEATFRMDRDDILIKVDFAGNIKIREYEKNKRNRFDNDDRYERNNRRGNRF